ncbi:ferric reductase-like transmembrane domain-containing protein [Paenibacillus sp. HWE-109]|uniref:ferric reductase-like transmembrane domain-containing protein n=1 Tax=Paenibacillus sp. HWE-109 TaxID=1306526 RepID=UPI001EDE8E90|nr:ferric reductase-like transmembrane domain-containing protein [Paenibacillus sp. HWE-109]UKS24352.1 ferric reductase-like transmembrane domain-containing protein [Paenibacillus sp. HWE-109]
MIQWLVDLPTWSLIRVFGILSYLSLFVGMAIGISYSLPYWKGPKKAQLLRWHTYANYTGTLLALAHTILLVIDAFMPFEWKEILIPFTAKQSTGLNGMGTIAVYGLLLLILTTDLRNKLRRKLWLAFHMLSYPIFLLALLHGLFIGTDSANVWIKTMYVSTFLLLVGLTAARVFIGARKRQVVKPKVYQA